MADTEQKLEQLLSKHTTYRADFKGTLEGWEKALKKAIATKEFANHAIIRAVREGYAQEIKEIQDVLLWSPDLTVEQRSRLFDKRLLCLRFLNLFSANEVTLEMIDQAVSFELGDKQL